MSELALSSFGNDSKPLSSTDSECYTIVTFTTFFRNN
jgi:hypothetical protein